MSKKVYNADVVEYELKAKNNTLCKEIYKLQHKLDDLDSEFKSVKSKLDMVNVDHKAINNIKEIITQQTNPFNDSLTVNFSFKFF